MVDSSDPVTVPAVLECLRDLCSDHDRRSERSVPRAAQLVATALNDRQRFIGLLNEALRVANGFLVDANTCGYGVELGPADESRLSNLNDAVERVLEKYNETDPEALLVLKLETDRVSITGSVSYESANTAQQSIRELLTAIYHPNLRGAPLTALVWADEAFDDRHRAIIWPLLMQLPTLLALPPGRTILLFAGDADLDFGLHCAGDPSLDGRINSYGYERRRSHESNIESIRELSRYSASDAPLIVIFLGAGASAVEGLPTGNELRNKALATQVGLAGVDESNFAEAAETFFDRLRSSNRLRAGEEANGCGKFVENLTLERVLLEEQSQENQLDCATIRGFREEHQAIIDALAAAERDGNYASDPLVNLLHVRRRLVLVTVNFDRILEAKAGDSVRAYVDESELVGLVDDLRQYRENGGPIPLIKLHGDIDRPQSIVVNIEETSGGLTAARLGALDSIFTVMKEQAIHPWWFVGYSMRDLDLQAFWQSAAFADVMVEHWVSPFVDPTVRGFIRSHRQSRWDRKSYGYNLDNRIVTVTASDFYGLLWEQVSSSWADKPT